GTFAARWELPREAGWRVRAGEDGATKRTGRGPLDIRVGNRHRDGNPGSRYRYDGVAHRLKRGLPSLLLDAVVALGLAFPDACTYLRWPLLGLYALFSFALLRRLFEHRWILSIVRDPVTRIAHGLEHATIAVLVEDGLPAIHGFTHGRDRFVVALEAGREPE